VAGLDRTSLLEALDRSRTWFWSDPVRHERGRADLVSARVEIVARALAGLGLVDAAATRRIAIAHTELRDRAIAPYPGALAVLDELRARGRTLGLITNGAAAAQRAKIERYELAPYFAYIGIEGEVGVGKPHPDAYRAAMAAIGFTPAEACMVGDNHEWDVAAPMRLGIDGVWVDKEGAGLPAGAAASRVIRTLAELVATA
jgi:putative hydrolase of the HAD superfamily